MAAMPSRFRKLLLTVPALLWLGIGPSAGGPNGSNVGGGNVTINGEGSSNVIVNQWSERAIINWRNFDIGSGETTQFIQPDASAVVLNRVTGSGPTHIDGTLTANGHVFIVNGDGVLIGGGAVVNTAGFLATTSNIKNSDFMAGRYNF